jgi:FkbM family methyltransferase
MAGLAFTSSKNLEALRSSQEEFFELKSSVFTSKIEDKFPREDVRKANSRIRESKAQLHQDLIALMFSKFKNGGFFVEFGATDGIKFSNTYLLEKSFDWNGILAEPGKNWHRSLKSNRTAHIETMCVWTTSGEILEFNETEIGELSTLEMFSSGDMHSKERISGKRYKVETISLEDLLDQFDAPKLIDYLSVDTEGSEFQILNRFNFDKYRFGFISCEHNYTSSRDQVYDLLTSKGYFRVLEDISLFDDWYIHKSLIKTE